MYSDVLNMLSVINALPRDFCFYNIDIIYNFTY